MDRLRQSHLHDIIFINQLCTFPFDDKRIGFSMLIVCGLNRSRNYPSISLSSAEQDSQNDDEVFHIIQIYQTFLTKHGQPYVYQIEEETRRWYQNIGSQKTKVGKQVRLVKIGNQMIQINRQDNKNMSLKDFQIVCKLGQGAYSTVFKVMRESDKQIYALKKVKLANLSDKQIENALNQVRILASIKNNNIVGYKQVFLQGKNLCIIMEFLDDGDLYQKIVEHKKKGQLFQQKQIWNVVIQILYGLKSLHTLNILHRDLKSANVFLSKEGFAKLGDLNVSKVAKNGLLYTQTGTPYYASPQVWKDQPYDMKSDIWSLGCVIYEMTTLQPPFQAQDMQGLYQSVVAGVFKPIDAKYSKQLSHLIKLMLQLKPKTRPSTQKILKSALIQKKIQQLSLDLKQPEQLKQELLRTIRIPKNLHYLTDKLPKPNYGNQSDLVSNHTLSNSPKLERNTRNTTGNNSISKGSLPKLSQIIRGSNSPSYLNKRKNKYKGDMLMVQGKSKIIQQVRSNEKNGKILEKQIRDQLKRIYKIKGVQSNDNIGRKKSQKSMLLPPIRL